MFAVGLIILAVASSVPDARPAGASGLTVEGVLLITAIVGAIACLVILGPRRTPVPAPAADGSDDELPTTRPASF
jgi:Ca2+/Na+ antiporter